MPKAFPTMITPYNRDGSIDIGAVDALVDWYWQKGCDGIFAACQSSEIFYLTVEERALLADRVKRRADALAASDPSRAPMVIVASGHVSDAYVDQLEELRRVGDTGVDAVILISNRLDIPNTGDGQWVTDCRRLCEALPGLTFGVYECPHPYKRLLTPAMLRCCAELGFRFIKDTCCDADVIRERLRLLEGTGVELYNANAQTLYQTLRDGAAGYCGIMGNFHPQLYAWLCHHVDDPRAELIGAAVSVFDSAENAGYPCSAKYYLDAFEGVHMGWTARCRETPAFTPYQRECLRQMKLLADSLLPA